MKIKRFYAELLSWCIVTGVGIVTAHLSQAAPVADEYQVKAAFLYHLSNFISWPPSAFTSDDQVFKICILGKDPFGVILDVTVENERVVGNRSVNVVRLNKIAETKICHILFTNILENASLKELFAITKNYPILTVSDSENFVVQGGMVEFFTLDNRIRLMINPDTVEWVGLKAKANLLRLSKIMQVPIPWK
ncbi:MAG: hypothetical protein BWK79_11710 [Beggiatoa sp. IS2]|nr:MAG: hypothetical protein BWK79_11710 [Beggiatoa sp. IS2]